MNGASHNIIALRIGNEEDFDDDGEAAAGSRLLKLLQLCNESNVIICVSRWFGGVKLGLARFKIINQIAKKLLLDSGIIQA